MSDLINATAGGTCGKYESSEKITPKQTKKKKTEQRVGKSAERYIFLFGVKYLELFKSS